MQYPPVCRLYCPRQPSTSFVLDSCAVTVLIVDVHASVRLSQKFRNPDTTNALEATYTFGLCADAAVCGFEMVREDGTKVEGVVKEKEEAKKEYDDAVKQGYTASLGSQETKDVFSISVGNIAPSEVVTINLRYLQTLKDDEKKDQVRFTFPRTYAQRYGHAPTTNAQQFGTAQQPFTLDATVQQSGTIKGVSCPSGHPMELELGKPEGFVVEGSADNSQFAKVTLRDSSGYLTQDVIIVVTATGLDNPRCFVESHPSPGIDTLAMGLTLVPRFKLPDPKSGMEYIFLVDRSGSMQGTNIRLVREALVVLLRGLPTKNTTFNVFSFGSGHFKLWDCSQEYTQTNLDAATLHVDSMQADYGGTEIASALQFVYSSLTKPLSRPVSVFLLTDGAAWDVSTCVSHTRSALSNLATDDNFIRVFTVGIGSGASTDTCDSVAKAGNGFSVYVADNEPMVEKCARLVRAARSPPIRDLEVLWTGAKTVEGEAGDDFEMVEDDAATLTDKDTSTPESSQAAPVSLFDDASEDDKEDVGPPPKPNVTLPPLPGIQQAPLNVINFFPGTRSQTYAIISNKQTSIPNSIKIRGVVAATGTPVELDVPVAEMAKSQHHNHALLHALAAKALITDRENKIHAFPESVSAAFAKNDALRDSYLEKDIVRLGTTYGLTSKHTSFVAIDRRTNKSNPTPPARRSDPTGGYRTRSAGAPRAMMLLGSDLHSVSSPPGRKRERMRSSAAPSATATAASGAGPPVLQNFIQSLLSSSSKSSGLSTSGSGLMGSVPGQAHDVVSDSSEGSRGGAISFSKKRSKASGPLPASGFPPPPMAAPSRPSARLASARDSPPSPTKDVESMSDGARLAAIARLQQFDGGFDFSDDLLRLLQVKVSQGDFKQKCTENNIEEGVAATVLALVWLEKKGGDESLDLQGKASEWLVDRLDEVDTAKEKISQRFRSPITTNALEAIYTFGLCADAAVCGFEMVREDGTKVEGVVKEKAQAKKEYDDAVKQGYTASLASEETKDVFSISVGNIAPSEVVTINLRYLQTLKDDEKKDQVRFTFPRTYAQRYGPYAPTTNAQIFGAVQQPFTLSATVQQPGAIKSVSLPSGHPVELELGKPKGVMIEDSTNDSQFAKISLRDSSGYLTQDVIIVVTATGLDNPRCFVESHPSPDVDTLAMGLTLVPRFKIPDPKSGMEYIFLVDRSGSMQGTNIRLVREALVVLLRGLPTKNTTFNVFSFGSGHSKLWDCSQEYTQTNLDAATQHVDSMQADYGGTEIASALQFVYSSLSKPLRLPVSVFLLTDGGAWDIPTCVYYTRSALSNFDTDDSFVRVFGVGIGSGASTDTCDSIAKAGNGFSVYVADNELVVGKCARLVRAARSPPIRDVEVQWTGVETVEAKAGDYFDMVEDDTTTLIDAEDMATPESYELAAPVSLFDDAGQDDTDDVGPPSRPSVTLPPPPRLQQAPLNVINLFPGTRSQMYAIISNKQTPIPSSIKIKGIVATTCAQVELNVPVAKMAKSQQQNHAFLHTLAAKALITDRENKIHAFPESFSAAFAKDDALRDLYLEKEIVRLGTTYGLISKHTSFVAIDHRTSKLNPTPPVSATTSATFESGLPTGTGRPFGLVTCASNSLTPTPTSLSRPPAPLRMSPLGRASMGSVPQAQHASTGPPVQLHSAPSGTGVFGAGPIPQDGFPNQPFSFSPSSSATHSASFGSAPHPHLQSEGFSGPQILARSRESERMRSSAAPSVCMTSAVGLPAGSAGGVIKPTPSNISPCSRPSRTSVFGSVSMVPQAHCGSVGPLDVDSMSRLHSAFSRSGTGLFGAGLTATSASSDKPFAFSPSPSAAHSTTFGSAPHPRMQPMGLSGPQTMSTGSVPGPIMMGGGATSGLFSAPPPPVSRAFAQPIAHMPMKARLAPMHTASFHRGLPPGSRKDVESMSDGARLAAIARFQQFDGGFDFSEGLLRLLQANISTGDLKQKFTENNIDEGVATTVLALVWLEKRGGDESLDLQEKASEWLADRLDEVDALKEQILGLFDVRL
ncbi:hypothetical protein PQX77_020376 [Marasmius sp. AFHP31]|nr:hypothetical protein PQX77_020376 [Marasmius sp. AFHP31]